MTSTSSSVRAKKSLGQNFLRDPRTISKIIEAANIGPEDTVIEVGPGGGALTENIAAAHPRGLFLIEKDSRLIGSLKESFSSADIIEGDALHVDAHELGDAPRKLISNLPYYISTPLLMKWLPHIQHFESIVLMFQKEVADRILAAHSTSSYGRLSVMCQWKASCERICNVPPGAFSPAPKVWSSVIKFTANNNANKMPFEHVEKIVKLAFSGRRKMVKKNVSSVIDDAQLKSIGISPTDRPENLTVEQYLSLAEHIL